MTQKIIATQFRAGVFDTVAEADQAIRRLRAAGFSQDQLGVICPARFKDHFHSEVPQAKTPGVGAGEAIATGSVIGAALGGLALSVTVLTGGLGAVAVAVFIGGGAFAGGFSNLIMSNGYEQEADDDYKQAIERGQIVVGVDIGGANAASQRAEAQRILDETGARAPQPV